MLSLCSKRHCLHWLVIGGALLAWGLFAPSRATASCGEYVTVLNQHFTNPPRANPISESGEDQSPPTPIGRKPCSGPGCSSTPSAPPIHSATVAPPLSEHTAHAAPFHPSFGVDPESWPRLNTHFELSSHGAAIFHPPRAATSSSH
jgi:hypothetical protein